MISILFTTIKCAIPLEKVLVDTWNISSYDMNGTKSFIEQVHMSEDGDFRPVIDGTTIGIEYRNVSLTFETSQKPNTFTSHDPRMLRCTVCSLSLIHCYLINPYKVIELERVSESTPLKIQTFFAKALLIFVPIASLVLVFGVGFILIKLFKRKD